MDTLSRIAEFLLLCAVILILLLVVNWSNVSHFQIGMDLRGYARAVRQSDMNLGEKEHLLDVIERIEDRLKSGQQIGLRAWCLHDQTIQELLADGIEGDEGRLIERELERTEEDFELTPPNDDQE
jgi:preprotein translocase subunit SecD